MKQGEIDKILQAHEKWSNCEPDGKKADLTRVDLTGVDLKKANLDYSCWPLWCGGLDVHIDDRQAIQLLYHLIRNVLYSKNTSDQLKKALGTKKLITLANKMHRVDLDRIALPSKEPADKPE